MQWNHKKSFSKNHRNCSPPGFEIATDKSRCGGYITGHWNCMTSDWIIWIGGLSVSWRFSARSFCDFLKNYLLQFHSIFLLFDKSIPLKFQMCFISSTLAYLCPNMIIFNVLNVLDFCEHRSEEFSLSHVVNIGQYLTSKCPDALGEWLQHPLNGALCMCVDGAHIGWSMRGVSSLAELNNELKRWRTKQK